MPFNPLIPRDLAVQLGNEAVQIGERGRYIGPNGPVVIAPQLNAAMVNTRHYAADHPHPAGQPGPHQTRLDVTRESTLSAHRRLQALGLNVVSLNFANAVVPGGGFLHGARAQEEYLCRSSVLYHTLEGSPMYEHNRAKRTALYSDAMIYSPEVPVFRDDDHKFLPSPHLASIITSPAPLATRLTPDERRQLRLVFTRRIHKVLSLAQSHGHDGLVLGAWGCGAFGNDCVFVANLFRQALVKDFRGAFKEVTFAIADVSPELRFFAPFALEFGIN